jgi:excinuclease UvrABC nuclease subunit
MTDFRMPLDWDWSSTKTAGRPHTVYVHLDGRGLPLYVGCTANLDQRTATHRSQAEWWPQVVEIRVIGTWSKEIALAVERGIIERFQPQYNGTFTKEWEAWLDRRRSRSPIVTTAPGQVA